MKQPYPHDDAFTGIEAAIVLIAFITVASVFTYIMLGTGFFATQTSQKVASAGVQGAASNILVVGDIYGLASDPSLGIDTVRFGVTLSKGGTPVDFRGSQMIISTEGLLETLAYTAGVAGDGQWDVSGSNENVLSDNQIWTVDAKPSVKIPPRTQFTLEVKPPGGASFSIRRTVPQGLDPVNILY
ncbi:MAG: flagellin [Methanomicrobiales archaeon]